jgi:2-methylcitrate dehydratase
MSLSTGTAALRRRIGQQAPRTLVAPSRSVASAPLLSRSTIVSNALRTPWRSPASVSQVSRFSTMTSLRSGIPPAAQREYDPEIKDMADYIHNYKIESDLAVGR